MKIARIFRSGLASIIMLMLLLPPMAMAQDSGETSQPPEFSNEELAQMLAPIALYPDSVVAAILMASTYPVEVVEAERWLRDNEGLTDDELDQALQGQTWDSSVKTLCHFPKVLYAMSDDLERTTRLGDAFLAQQDDVMNMIQQLRERAMQEGNLSTTEKLSVTDEQGVITIEPANPEVIYLPVYNPLYVYGPWWYPAYPPYYWYPSGVVVTSGYIGFWSGIFIGAGISTWCWPDWHHHRIDIDVHKTARFNRFDRGRWDFNRHVWKHNPVHRRGAAYRSSITGRRFGEQIPRIQRIRPEMRGYESPRQAEPSRGNIQRREVPATRNYREGIPRQPSRGTIQPGKVPRTRTYREGVSREPSRGAVQQRQIPESRTHRETTPKRTLPGSMQLWQVPAGGNQRRSGESYRGNIFQGVGQGNSERRSSQRGFQSRQSERSFAPAGGGIRRGGSRSGGGGGRSGGFRK